MSADGQAGDGDRGSGDTEHRRPHPPPTGDKPTDKASVTAEIV